MGSASNVVVTRNRDRLQRRVYGGAAVDGRPRCRRRSVSGPTLSIQHTTKLLARIPSALYVPSYAHVLHIFCSFATSGQKYNLFVVLRANSHYQAISSPRLRAPAGLITLLQRRWRLARVCSLSKRNSSQPIASRVQLGHNVVSRSFNTVRRFAPTCQDD